MSAIIIDGVAMARQVLGELKVRVDAFSRGGKPPGLAVLLVGDDPASAVYVRSKERACRDAGVRTFDTRMPATATQADLLKKIDALNADQTVHGILVQLPLPPHIDADDLYSVGVTGLIAAVRKYNPEQGNTFAGYAATRIRGAILDELRRLDWCPRRTRASKPSGVSP